MTFGRVRLADWMLDPSVTYLNHGTVGAVPRRVLAAQQAIRDRLERAPSRFMLRELVSLVGAPRAEPGLLRRAAASVADFVGVDQHDLVFVDNVTTGVNPCCDRCLYRPARRSSSRTMATARSRMRQHS